jgi:hypothetical protein
MRDNSATDALISKSDAKLVRESDTTLIPKSNATFYKQMA